MQPLLTEVAAEGNPRPDVDAGTCSPADEPFMSMIGAIEWSDSLAAHARQLARHWELLLIMTQREIKVRYKQTVLGAVWAVLQPVALMLVFTVFLSLFAGFGSGEVPYPLFSFAGLLPWTFFSTALSFATPSLVTNSHIITRIYFPREIIPLASVFAALVDFAFGAVFFVGLLAVYHVAPTWSLLYVVPLLGLQVVFTTAMCLLLSGFTVLYRDARFTLPLLIQVWMFATPILYPASSVPERIREVYLTLNPMAVLVDGYRRAVLLGQPPDLPALAGASLVASALLWLAYKYFKHLEREFADLV